MDPRSRPEPDRRQLAWAWRCVQMDWVETGWDRIYTVMDRQPGLGLVMALVMVVVTTVLGSTAMADLPTWGQYLVLVPVLLVVFVATGWVVLPWLISTDRRRAALPVGVLVVGVAISCAGGWWMLPGMATMVVSAGLGIAELGLIGRDVEIELLKD